MGNLRIGLYVFVSKFWAVEDVITRGRTASGHVNGADDLVCSTLDRHKGHHQLDDDRYLMIVAVAEPIETHLHFVPIIFSLLSQTGDLIVADVVNLEHEYGGTPRGRAACTVSAARCWSVHSQGAAQLSAVAGRCVSEPGPQVRARRGRRPVKPGVRE